MENQNVVNKNFLDEWNLDFLTKELGIISKRVDLLLKNIKKEVNYIIIYFFF